MTISLLSSPVSLLFLLEVKKVTINVVTFFKCFVVKKATIASCHYFIFFPSFLVVLPRKIVNCSSKLTIKNDLMVFLNV
jgi:hypothetical protein